MLENPIFFVFRGGGGGWGVGGSGPPVSPYGSAHENYSVLLQDCDISLDKYLVAPNTGDIQKQVLQINIFCVSKISDKLSC